MSLLTLLFPPRCVLCHEFLRSAGDETCPACARWVTGHLGQKRRTCLYVDGPVASALPYDGHTRGAVRRFKFYHRPHYARAFARWMYDSLDRESLDKASCITWVPSGHKKYRQRGYVPCQLLARELSRLSGKPAVALLRKRPFVRQQSLLRGQTRQANILGAFEGAAALKDYRGADIFLVDDVITTGATLSECAKVLKFHGACMVYAATFVAARRKND